MAATPTPRPKPADPRAGVPAALAHLDLPLPLAVAYSGGADSTALLHAAVRRWPGQVHALHVHHGLQAAADAFESHCRAACEALHVPLHAVRVQAGHAPGQSPEDAARQARYAALATLAKEANVRCVLLGQHADDQVETILLALSRGAGVPGLAAMPAAFDRHGVHFVRPFLHLPGKALRAWLQAEGIAFTADPTNADPAYTRNRIRGELLPVLERVFPQHRETFSRSARHAAQASELLDALAQQDLAAMQGEAGIDGLRALARARQANVLRHWLRVVHGAAASTAQLDELLDQVAACSTRGHGIELRVGTGFVVREGHRLAFRPSV